ncbi:hypothetical protein OIU78_006831 [Salix suchowensis]|nr:hypothetical protein OIU78_006831 [Salix suchowensis]
MVRWVHLTTRKRKGMFWLSNLVKQPQDLGPLNVKNSSMRFINTCLASHHLFLNKTPAQGSEEHPTTIEGETHESSQDAGAVTAAEDRPNPAVGEIHEVGERAIEEVLEAHITANPSPAETSASREVPAKCSSDQLLQRQVTRVQKPADDRLFTWAAVGLTFAIVVLLLKKFMKSSGYGALFMDGS